MKPALTVSISLNHHRHRINGNAYKSCFWLLAHILHDPSLLEDIRTEIDQAFWNGGDVCSSPNIARLLEDCPLLNSTYDEILRYTNNAMGVRLVVNQTRIGGKTLRPWRKLLMPYRQMHLDGDVWGSGAANFDPNRFTRDKSLSRSPIFSLLVVAMGTARDAFWHGERSSCLLPLSSDALSLIFILPAMAISQHFPVWMKRRRLVAFYHLWLERTLLLKFNLARWHLLNERRYEYSNYTHNCLNLQSPSLLLHN